MSLQLGRERFSQHRTRKSTIDPLHVRDPRNTSLGNFGPIGSLSTPRVFVDHPHYVESFSRSRSSSFFLVATGSPHHRHRVSSSQVPVYSDSASDSGNIRLPEQDLTIPPSAKKTPSASKRPFMKRRHSVIWKRAPSTTSRLPRIGTSRGVEARCHDRRDVQAQFSVPQSVLKLDPHSDSVLVLLHLLRPAIKAWIRLDNWLQYGISSYA